jgi:hypothetical protein
MPQDLHRVPRRDPQILQQRCCRMPQVMETDRPQTGTIPKPLKRPAQIPRLHG